MNTLKSFCETRGNAAKLAEETGIAATTICRLVKGEIKRPSHETVVRIEAGLKKLKARHGAKSAGSKNTASAKTARKEAGN